MAEARVSRLVGSFIISAKLDSMATHSRGGFVDRVVGSSACRKAPPSILSDGTIARDTRSLVYIP